MRRLLLILLIFFSGAVSAQHLPHAEPALQEYLDTIGGKQAFLNVPLKDKDVGTVTQWLTGHLLAGADNYTLQNSHAAQSPDGTYFTFDLHYKNVQVFAQTAKVLVDNQQRVRWLFHTVSPIKNEAEHIVTDNFITSFYNSNYSQLLLSKQGKLWVDDGVMLIPGFYLTLKDTLRYTLEQKVFNEKGDLLYISPLYSQYQAADTPVNTSAYVYDPDPLTTAAKNYGEDSLAHNNGANSRSLQAQLRKRSLRQT